ncbi:MAG: hypothetical protein DRR19_33435 [Candidatus Parabeggiatoa sp. nov. 1]|nr:MAG: hypothetical protein DRR19_33435 [Gammaproteobacteria bacterium]
MFENYSRKMLVGLISGTLFSTTIALAANDKTYYLMDSQGNPVMTKYPDCVLTPKTHNLPAKPLEVCGDILDKDGDGVLDDEDACPENSSEQIAQGVVQHGPKKGCPIDSDNDGVPDYRDACPAQSESIDGRGCSQDTDRDGVFNNEDVCPNNSPEEIAKGVIQHGFQKGCPIDRDNDSVPDYRDDCPTQYEGVDARGCSRDTDEDRVFDYKDECPGTLFGVEVDTKGCALPPPPPEPELRAAVALTDKVLFDYNMADLTYQTRTGLDGLISQAGGVESIEHVNIVGHADDRGTEEYNQRLSEERATSVANYFIGKGLSAEKITQRGDGELYPVFSNQTDEDRTQNRRVEITIKPF